MTREELLQLIDKAADEGWTELDLAGLQLEELPAQIAKCTQLETLLLGKWNRKARRSVGNGNKLTEFPDVVLQLTNLKILNLRNNKITCIPEDLGQLSNLTHLYLGCNQITSIPEAIGLLSNLTHLYLNNNQITSIPEAIRGMKKLEKLDLQGNPLPIPPEILQGQQYYRRADDLRTLLNFYFQTRNPNNT